MNFFSGRSVSAVCILHVHKNEKEGVVVLLNDSAEEFGSAPQVHVQLQGAHVLLDLTELLLNRFYIVKKLHL